MKEQNEISTVYMLDALDEARTAAAAGEVPVGALFAAEKSYPAHTTLLKHAAMHPRMQNCLRSAQQQKNLALAA